MNIWQKMIKKDKNGERFTTEDEREFYEWWARLFMRKNDIRAWMEKALPEQNWAQRFKTFVNTLMDKMIIIVYNEEKQLIWLEKNK